MSIGSSIRAGRAQLPDIYDLNIGKVYYEGAQPDAAFEFDNLISMEKSDTDQHTFARMGGLGNYVEKPVGEAIDYSQVIPGYSITARHKTFALGWMIPWEDEQDDPRGILQTDVAKDLGGMARVTAEELAGTALDSAFTSKTSAFQTGSDGGTYFFATDHNTNGINASGGTYANTPATAIDLSVTALQQAEMALTNMPNPRGKRLIGIRPTKLRIGRNLKWIWQEILKSSGVPYVASDTPNTVKMMGLDVGISNYMTRTNAWWLEDASTPAFKGYWRYRPEVQRDNEFSTGNRQYKGIFRISFYYNDPRRAYGSPGAAA